MISFPLHCTLSFSPRSICAVSMCNCRSFLLCSGALFSLFSFVSLLFSSVPLPFLAISARPPYVCVCCVFFVFVFRFVSSQCSIIRNSTLCSTLFLPCSLALICATTMNSAIACVPRSVSTCTHAPFILLLLLSFLSTCVCVCICVSVRFRGQRNHFSSSSFFFGHAP